MQHDAGAVLGPMDMHVQVQAKLPEWALIAFNKECASLVLSLIGLDHHDIVWVPRCKDQGRMVVDPADGRPVYTGQVWTLTRQGDPAPEPIVYSGCRLEGAPSGPHGLLTLQQGPELTRLIGTGYSSFEQLLKVLSSRLAVWLRRVRNSCSSSSSSSAGDHGSDPVD